jgi:hypothetical protein
VGYLFAIGRMPLCLRARAVSYLRKLDVNFWRVNIFTRERCKRNVTGRFRALGGMPRCCIECTKGSDVVALMRGVGTMIFLSLSSVGRAGELHVSVIRTKKRPSEAHAATGLCDVFLGSHSLFPYMQAGLDKSSFVNLQKKRLDKLS